MIFQSWCITRLESETLRLKNEQETLKINLLTNQEYGGEIRLAFKEEAEEKQIIKRIKKIEKEISGISPCEQMKIDKKLKKLSELWENRPLEKAILLAVSQAVCQLSASYIHRPLYEYLGGISGRNIPCPVFELPLEQKVVLEGNYSLYEKEQMGQQIKECFAKTPELNSFKEVQLKMEEIARHLGISKEEYMVMSWSKRRKSNLFFELNSSMISTVTEMIELIKTYKMNGKMAILQSGRNDIFPTFLADLAVGLNVQYIDLEKANEENRRMIFQRLLSIEQALV